ncbi:histidine phosphatase family protein [Dyella sp. ASV21]|uniref:histidine phosphatase family protein n=1 Tax=Dyella sp. ASV21 TaxID=2795114 RepID=UPI0018EDD6B0|nr:histidine phosphatase family protein [Dyella sp. ASV21]
MTTLLLIRHGEVEGIQPPTFRGRLDLALTAKGQRQAELTRDYLAAHWKLDTIYCSPLSRCMRTAHTLAEAYQLQGRPHPGLLDIDYGSWSSLPVSDVEQRWPREARLWKVAPHRFRIPGGESIQEVAARTTDALATILQAHPDENIALVTHDSVIRVLLCHAAGLPLSSYWLFQPSPCGVHVLEVDEGFTIQAVNNTQHLLNA